MHKVVIFFYLLFTSSSIFAQTLGSLDTTFGTNGKAMFGSLAANYSNQLTDAFLETNGKIVM